jgi:hypothetical protein
MQCVLRRVANGCDSVISSQTVTNFKHTKISFQPLHTTLTQLQASAFPTQWFYTVLCKLCKSYVITYHKLSLYCTVLHLTPLYCTVLHHTAPYCTVLHRTTLYCTILHCTAPYCTVLHHTALYCTVLHCTIPYCTVLHRSALYCTVLHCTALHCTTLYCTAGVGKGTNGGGGGGKQMNLGMLVGGCVMKGDRLIRGDV